MYTLTATNNSTDSATGLPAITGSVTVVGNGATIVRSSSSGTPVFRFFDVASSGHLTLSALTLSNGITNNGSSGGGAIDTHGVTSVTGTTFTGNSSPSASGTSGGAIDNSGQLTVTGSTFVNNLAMEGAGIFNQNLTSITQTTFLNNTATIYGGGGIVNAFGTTNISASTFVGNTGPGGGAIDNDTALNVTNSTFFNNTGGSSGGGAIQNFGTAAITQSTLSGNTSQYGANIHNYGSSTVAVSSSIVANGVSGSNCGGPPIIDKGYNVDTGTSCGFAASAHSVSSTQPHLEAIASNGGPTQTMALPPNSPAVDRIPTSVNGCAGGVDQRGVARPQGTACDVGAFEVISSTGDTQPPTTPQHLTAPSVTAHSVTLKWDPSTDNVAVTGYTVYRNGVLAGSTGGATATSFADSGAASTTTYSYTVDAFDGSGNHSPKTTPLTVTTPAPSGVQAVQGQAMATPSRVTSATIPLTNAIYAGDLLVGWFGQYDAAGPVQVSDDVNGPWTRSASTTFSSGAGDIALYYVQNAAPSSYGVTVTVAASSATFLQGSASDYSGVARAGALHQVAVAKAVGTAVDSGATAAVGAGELVVGGIMTGGSPGATSPGASQGQPFTMRAQTVSGSSVFEDVLSSVAGTQNARATLTASTDWYAAAAVFHQFGGGDTTPPAIPTGVTQDSVSASAVTFHWTASTDNVGVTGYTVYRGGVSIGTTNGTTTTYTDSTVSPSTPYSYTVDAFDAAGNHSNQSSPALSVTTPAAPPPMAHWVQGGAVATGSKVASTSIALTSAVASGDLLVGWFGQYDSTGRVQVSDSINGAWTRSSAATTFSGGGGDIALFYVQNAKSAPAGVIVTLSAASATYLQGSASDYAGMALTNSLDKTSVASGNSAAADSGTTASVGAGELLVSGFMTGSSPGTVTAGSGMTMHAHTASYSVDDASAFTTAGTQHAQWTLQTSADWYVVAAVFHTAAGP